MHVGISAVRLTAIVKKKLDNAFQIIKKPANVEAQAHDRLVMRCYLKEHW